MNGADKACNQRRTKYDLSYSAYIYTGGQAVFCMIAYGGKDGGWLVEDRQMSRHYKSSIDYNLE